MDTPFEGTGGVSGYLPTPGVRVGSVVGDWDTHGPSRRTRLDPRDHSIVRPYIWSCHVFYDLNFMKVHRTSYRRRNSGVVIRLKRPEDSGRSGEG